MLTTQASSPSYYVSSFSICCLSLKFFSVGCSKPRSFRVSSLSAGPMCIPGVAMTRARRVQYHILSEEAEPRQNSNHILDRKTPRTLIRAAHDAL